MRMVSSPALGSSALTAMLIVGFASGVAFGVERSEDSTDEGHQVFEDDKEPRDEDDYSSGDEKTAGDEEVEITPETHPEQFEEVGPPVEDWREEYWGVDVNVDLSAVRHRQDWGWAGSLRAGVRRVDEPFVWTLAPTVELATGLPTRLGMEAEMTNLHLGLYGQLGAGMDLNGEFAATGAVGWSMLAFETQYRPGIGPEDRSDWAYLGKLRIPVIWFYEAFAD